MAALAGRYAAVFAARAVDDATVLALVHSAIDAESSAAGAVAPSDGSLALDDIPRTACEASRVFVPQSAASLIHAVFGDLYTVTASSAMPETVALVARDATDTNRGYAVGWGRLIVDAMRTEGAALTLDPHPASSASVEDRVQDAWDKKGTVLPPLVDLAPDAPKYTVRVAQTTYADAMGAKPGVRDDVAGRPPAATPVDPSAYARAREEVRRTRGEGVAVAFDDMRRAADTETRQYNIAVASLFDALEGEDVRASEDLRTRTRNTIVGMELCMQKIGPGIARKDGPGAAASMVWAGMNNTLAETISTITTDMASRTGKDVDSDDPLIVASGLTHLAVDAIVGRVNTTRCARAARAWWRGQLRGKNGAAARNFSEAAFGSAGGGRTDAAQAQRVIADAMASNLRTVDEFALSETRAGRMRPAERDQLVELTNQAMTAVAALFENGQLEVDRRGRTSPTTSVGARGDGGSRRSKSPARRGSRARMFDSDEEDDALDDEFQDPGAGASRADTDAEVRAWSGRGGYITLFFMLSVVAALIFGGAFSGGSARYNGSAPEALVAGVARGGHMPIPGAHMDAQAMWSSPDSAGKFVRDIESLRQYAVELGARRPDGNIDPILFKQLLREESAVTSALLQTDKDALAGDLATVQVVVPTDIQLSEQLDLYARASVDLKDALEAHSQRANALRAIAAGESDPTVVAPGTPDELVPPSVARTTANRQQFAVRAQRTIDAIAKLVDVNSHLAREYMEAVGGNVLGADAPPAKRYADLARSVVVGRTGDIPRDAMNEDQVRETIVEVLEETEGDAFDLDDPVWRAWVARATEALTAAHQVYAGSLGMFGNFMSEVGNLEALNILQKQESAQTTIHSGDTTMAQWLAASDAIIERVQQRKGAIEMGAARQARAHAAEYTLDVLYGTNPRQGAMPWSAGSAGANAQAEAIRILVDEMLASGGSHGQCQNLLFYNADTPHRMVAGSRIGIGDSPLAFASKWMRAGGNESVLAPKAIVGHVLYHVLGGSALDAMGNGLWDMGKAIGAVASQSGDLASVMGEIFAGLGRTATLLVVLQKAVVIFRAISVMASTAERRLLANRTLEQLMDQMSQTGASAAMILGRGSAVQAARTLSRVYAVGAQGAEIVAFGGRSLFGIPTVSFLMGIMHIACGTIRFTKGSYERLGTTVEPGILDYAGLGLPAVASLGVMVYGGKWAVRQMGALFDDIGRRADGKPLEPSFRAKGQAIAMAQVINVATFVPDMGTRILGGLLFGTEFIRDPNYRRRTIAKMSDPAFLEREGRTAASVLAYQIFGTIGNVVALNLFGAGIAQVASHLAEQPYHSSDVASVAAEFIRNQRQDASNPLLASGRIPATLEELGRTNVIARAAGVGGSPIGAQRVLRTLEDGRTGITAAQAVQCDAIVSASEALYIDSAASAVSNTFSSSAWSNYLKIIQGRTAWKIKMDAIRSQIVTGELQPSDVEATRVFVDNVRTLFLPEDGGAGAGA